VQEDLGSEVKEEITRRDKMLGALVSVIMILLILLAGIGIFAVFESLG